MKNKTRFKNFFAVLLGFSLLLSMSACSPDKQGQLDAIEISTVQDATTITPDSTQKDAQQPSSQMDAARDNNLPAAFQNSYDIAMAASGYGLDEVVMAVTGSNLANLGAYEFDFQASAPAQVASASLGDVLTQTGRTVGVLGPSITNNIVEIGAYSTGAQPGFTGDGNLAFITLDATQDGVSLLSIENFLAVEPDATPLALTVQPTMALQTHGIAAGWNFTAPCVDVSSASVSVAFTSIYGNYDLVLGSSGQYEPGGTDTLGNLGLGNAYWVRTTAGGNQTLAFFGDSASVTSPVELTAGWHWLGYCLNDPMSVTTALASLDGSYDLVIGETGAYAPGLGASYQSLTQLTSGEGYLLHLTQTDTLTFPIGEADSAPAGILSGCPSVDVTPDNTLAYGTITLDGLNAPAGTVVELVTPRNEVAGCITVGSDGIFGLALAYGEDSSGGITGFRDGDAILLRVDGCTAESNSTWQNDRWPREIDFEASGGTCLAQSRYKVFLPLVIR